MKAISLWQPWASLVAVGAKRIETRHWSTNHRGPLAIHAAKKWTRELREQSLERPFREVLWPGVEQPERLGYPDVLPLGAILAVAELYHCGEIVAFGELGRHRPVRGLLDPAALSAQEEAFGNYEAGRFAWGLEKVRRLAEPIPYRGAQGLFEVPDDLLEDVDFCEARTRAHLEALRGMEPRRA